MSRNAIENVVETSQLRDLNPPKKFSKVKIFQLQGLLTKKFNYQTNEFEDSSLLSAVSYLTLVSKALFGFKPLVSCFFPQTAIQQLWIGSIYNYLPELPRLILGIATAIAGVLQLGYHVVFNGLNTRENYRLFKFWMKLTHEIPVKSDRDYRVAGLSRQANKAFWAKENSLNLIWSRVMKGYILFYSIMYGSQIFFVKFDGVEIMSASYILIQTMHVTQTCHALFCVIHCFFTLNLFYATVMRFFSKRFQHIGGKVGRLSDTESPERFVNRKLAKLLIEYNKVHHDLILINDFFKSFVGLNMLGSFAMDLTVVFVVFLETDWRLKVIFCFTVVFLHVTFLGLPFVMAKLVTSEIQRTKRHFENIAFNRSVNLAIKQKIELISNLSEKAGFTCFGWFLLDSHAGLMISLEFMVSLLLLFEAYLYYKSQF